MLQTKYQELSILSVARRISWVVDTVPSSVCLFFQSLHLQPPGLKILQYKKEV